MFGRYMGYELRPSGGDTPFSAISGLLNRADLSLVNLETPLSDHDPTALFRFPLPARNLRFRAPTTSAQQLADSGIDVAVLANNHAEDCGRDGVEHTIKALNDVGVLPVGGAAKPPLDPGATVWLQRAGLQVAVIAATTRRNRGTPHPGEWIPVAFGRTGDLLRELPVQVQSATEQGADIVIVSLHWGLEFAPHPNGAQRTLARALVDAGASVVLGHHAHVLQPVEAYGDGLILYNMGNLIFDLLTIEGRRTALFQITFTPDAATGRWLPSQLIAHPLLIPNRHHGPQPARGEHATRIIDRLAQASSSRYGTDLRRAGDRLIWRSETNVVEGNSPPPHWNR